MAVTDLTRANWAQPLTRDPARSHTLPARSYFEPEAYARDLEGVFHRTWQYVGHVSQFAAPGDYVAHRIADQSIVVLRDDKGELRGYHNVCRHRGHELLEGEGNARPVIVCPYHAWAYGLDGRLRSARKTETLPDFDKAAICLPEVRVETLGPFVFANVDLDAPPLADIAGDMLAEMRAAIPWLEDGLEVRDRFAAGDAAGQAANWKVAVENFLECYHCRPAHPAWADLTDMGRYEVEVHGYWSSQRAPEVKLDNRAYAIDADAPMKQGFWWVLWPNTTFNFMPGERSLIVMCVQPLGVERCEFVGHVLYPEGEVADARRIDYASVVLGMEDQKICESVQRGLHSLAYDQGRIVAGGAGDGEEEHALHWFHWLMSGVYEGEGGYPPLP